MYTYCFTIWIQCFSVQTTCDTEDTEVPATKALTPRSTTDIFEVSPGNETIVEITVKDIEQTQKPSILTPFTEKLTVSLLLFNS